MYRVVITGPESSGKSTLTAHLAAQLDVPYVPEYARTYLAGKGTEYDLKDIVNIAIGQMALVEATEQAHPHGTMILIDTWMLELRIWAQYRFGVVPNILEELHREQLPDFYVLCRPDIPWEPDPLRENPDDRDVLYVQYERAIQESGVAFCVVSGSGDARGSNVASALSAYFQDGF